MHILAALDRPTDGYVTIAGTRLGQLSDKDITKIRRKHIGFIFQFFNLLPMLTAEENMTCRSRSPARSRTRLSSGISSSGSGSQTA